MHIYGDKDMEEKIFDIPVYICPQDEFNIYWDNHCRKLIAKDWISETEQKEIVSIFRKSNHKKTAWKYQAVIGYIEIYKHGCNLIATLSMDVRERKVKGGRADIYYDPSTFYKMYFKKDMTSLQIITQFKLGLEETIKERLNGRYVDMESFDNISEYIDWHKMLFANE